MISGSSGLTLRVLVLALAAAVSGCASPAPRAKRPNILFIAIDDLRPELGCYGVKHVISPNIDRLATTGVTFTRAYCQQAVCNPSRASLMTGLRPDTIRVWDLRTGFRKARPNAVTIAQHFMRHGYHTAAIGKIFHNNIQDDASWSEPKLQIDGYPYDPDAVYRARSNLDWLEQRKQAILRQGKRKRYIDRFGKWYLKANATEIADVPDDAYFDGAQTTVAVAKLRELKDRDQPFFMAVGYYRPHLPFNVPKRYWDLYDRDKLPLAEHGSVPKGSPPMAINTMRELHSYVDFKGAKRPDQEPLPEARVRLLRHGYMASVSYIDAQVGRLMQEHDRLGLRDDTIVVLWGDHGWKLGDQGSFCKMTNYEIDARVPLIVCVPGARENGRQCHRLVEFVDLYPTLSALAGLPPRKELEGSSFVPLLEDRARAWKSAVFTQFLRSGKWVAPDGVPYMGRSIRTRRHRYVEWRRWRGGSEDPEVIARELYDHRTDPLEAQNIADRAESRPVVASLADRLRAGWRAALPQ